MNPTRGKRALIGCSAAIAPLLLLYLYPWQYQHRVRKTEGIPLTPETGQLSRDLHVAVSLAEAPDEPGGRKTPPTIPSGIPIVLTVTLRNATNRKLTILDVRPVLYGQLLRFHLFKDGEPVAPHPSELQTGGNVRALVRMATQRQFRRADDAVLELLPGTRYRREYNLSQVFPLSEPGAYRVRVLYDVAHFARAHELGSAIEGLDRIRAESAFFAFRIAPPAARKPPPPPADGRASGGRGRE